MNVPNVSDLFDFTDQAVLVTGSGTGIGAGIAMRFAEAGADVVVAYRSSARGADDVVRRIEAIGRRALAIRANVTRTDDVEHLVSASLETFGRIDVVINNAGIYPLAALSEMSDDAWRQSLDANLTSVFLVTRAVTPAMREAGQGAIINIASIEGRQPAPQHSHYATAKAGVHMHTRAAALELGGDGIRVNSVSPGLIWRQGIEEQWPEGVERWHRAAPLERLGHPEDVADACLFLASPAARWITGTDLAVDGGVLARPAF